MERKMRPTIGILAGMGPKSTGPFIDQVVLQFQSIAGAKDDIDFPPMMIYSLPTPFYVDRPIDHKLMEKTLCDGLKRLESCGVAFIAIPCNTAHIYFETIRRCVHAPLLNIVKETLKAIPPTSKKIGILGTRATIDSQIFQKELDQKALPYILDEKWQKMVDEMIGAIKKEGGEKQLFSLWENLSKDLRSHHVDTIVLACTDLNAISKKIEASFKVIDSSLCLARAIVKKYAEIS